LLPDRTSRYDLVLPPRQEPADGLLGDLVEVSHADRVEVVDVGADGADERARTRRDLTHRLS